MIPMDICKTFNIKDDEEFASWMNDSQINGEPKHLINIDYENHYNIPKKRMITELIR